MERPRQAFGLVYEIGSDVDLNGPSVLGGVLKEVEGAAGKLRERLPYTKYDLKSEEPSEY